jgi:hypothetical protein
MTKPFHKDELVAGLDEGLRVALGAAHDGMDAGDVHYSWHWAFACP